MDFWISFISFAHRKYWIFFFVIQFSPFVDKWRKYIFLLWFFLFISRFSWIIICLMLFMWFILFSLRNYFCLIAGYLTTILFLFVCLFLLLFINIIVFEGWNKDERNGIGILSLLLFASLLLFLKWFYCRAFWIVLHICIDFDCVLFIYWSMLVDLFFDFLI